MIGQLTIWDFPETNIKSRCLDCFYECNGRCGSWVSKYEDMTIPINGCDCFDGISGGIPTYEELRGRYNG